VDKAAVGLSSGAPAEAMMAARRALRVLDNGGVLDGEPHTVWAEPARTMHGTLLRRARLYLAESALRLSDLHTAQTVSEAAVVADELDEVACRLLMHAYHAAGEPARALRVFHQLSALLDDNLGVYPSAATRELHIAILQDKATIQAARPALPR
jgi:DNA-binding SARP family transcriptional activator